MNQYRIAIENYSSANNSLYPREGATICADVELCTNPGDLTNFISTCPKDPKSTPACSGSPDRYYDYEVTTARDKYVMYVYGGFEAEANKTWVVCWDGKVGVTNNAWAGVGGIEEFCPNVHNL
ncbi:MAG: hypothetical protein Q8Q15_01015 [bacterium]|nr:hypothetical protein [bacterium]